jgi:hypothetical protein
MITSLEKVKIVLGITGTSYDNLITELIPLVEDDYLAIRRKDFDLDDDDEIVYPVGSENTAIQMVGYQMSMQGINGVQSESLGSHSITYESANGIGYPNRITDKIRRYQEFI